MKSPKEGWHDRQHKYDMLEFIIYYIKLKYFWFIKLKTKMTWFSVSFDQKEEAATIKWKLRGFTF